MGFSKIEIDEKGQASFYCVPEEFHYNPIGSVHGGLAATLLDSCNSISAQCNLDKGFIALTTDIKVNYLSQISADTGEIVARGKIDKLGRTDQYSREGWLSTGGLAIGWAILCFGLADKIYI